MSFASRKTNLFNFLAEDLTKSRKYSKIYDTQKSYGAAMVSTGVLKYDKRSAPDNRVKMSKLKE